MGPTGPLRRVTHLPGLTGVFVCLVFISLNPRSSYGDEPGQTPRPKGVEPPNVPEEELVRLDKKFEHFLFVEDDAPFINRGNRLNDALRMQAADHEQKAYDYVLHFARRQPDERLEKYSYKNVKVEDLYHGIRKDYLRELIRVEGKLALVSEMKPTEELEELSGIEKLYEVWVYAKGTSKLVCLVVSELPEGVTPGEDFDLMVSFDAYYFKLWHYESRQPRAGGDPEKKQWQRAPLFLGKTFRVLYPVESKPETFTPVMLIAIVGGLCGLGLAAFLISLWFRRGDRHARDGAMRRIADEARFDSVPESPNMSNRFSDLS